MKVMLVGAAGQVGRALVDAAPTDWTLAALTRNDLDIGDEAAVARAVEIIGPDLIVNSAAYTAVDRAEIESELAFQINRDGAGHLAAAAARRDARLVHLSTDFVFGGSAGRPYRPDDPTGPLGAYGASKLAGEKAVAAAAPEALILRTAWVYGPAAGSNFLATMLRLMAARPELGVVADQLGTPTSTLTLAEAIWTMVGKEARGIWHFTDAGTASWYDFAVAIAEEAVATGLLASAPPVRPISTEDYPTPARRPAYSVLDKTATFALLGAAAPHWRVALRAVLARMAP
ncbi:MAG TPA: dTDP-4-dehydrorhamnose reductase [Caulobacteraceae bacterium]|nr:dTDP-4-dehydrorhamnose reductase [Caulobacteraceae bacterium]